VAGVHAEGHLGHPTITAKVTLAREDPEQKTFFEVVHGEVFLASHVFHRQVSRETDAAFELLCVGPIF
jgi:hypothetical protein